MPPDTLIPLPDYQVSFRVGDVFTRRSAFEPVKAPAEHTARGVKRKVPSRSVDTTDGIVTVHQGSFFAGRWVTRRSTPP